MFDSIKKIYILLPKHDHIKFAILFLSMIFAAVIELLGIGVVPAFIITIADSELIFNTPYVGTFLINMGITTSTSLIVAGALIMIIVYAFKNVYLVMYQHIKTKFIKKRAIYLQNRIFKAYLTAPYTYYLNQNSSVLLRNVTSEVNKIITGTLLPLLDITLKGFMFVFIIGTLFYLEPIITLVTVVVLGGGGYVFLRFTKNKISEYGKKDRRARSRINKAVLQGLGAFKDTRVLNREKMFLEKYDFHAKVSVEATVYKTLMGNLPKPIIEILMITGILAITLIMVLEGRPFSVIIPILTLFGVSAIKLMPIFSTVIQEVNNLRYNSASVYAVYDDLMLLENEYADFRDKLLNKTHRLDLKEKIELRNVTFNYPNSEEQAVNNISLDVPKGASVAFVGASGAGKTTLVDIILGLLEPTKGEILVDGFNINDNLPGWMENIGYIPQSIYLLDDTILRNIAFGIPDDLIDREKYEKAIKAAQLEVLIERLPKKENTRVGERGIRLSGGQRQRIGIARALYNNPQVLIMDEATSALDNITEKFVIDSLERLRGDRTILMIAHRLTTVKNCDIIYLMEEGQVVGKGNYEELLENNEKFRKMSLIED